MRAARLRALHQPEPRRVASAGASRAIGDNGARHAIAAAHDAGGVFLPWTGWFELRQNRAGGRPHHRPVELHMAKALRRHADLVSPIDLKIDTQGFEMKVLRDAGDMLGRMAAVQAELGLRPIRTKTTGAT